ncbi:hypothetical protein [Nocardioides jejuensis]|uniref:Uncharacterized protein n=1 Tax=Nocardioides jejuensis TaxID=2502782 RepID=A0A4R1BWL2_9ACTN|nr:hypothetical protein [Nocardioides jejuensis]TCJ21665.1 hypothetical protein EPD65_14655 [Nocardioides jejuensis]
MCAASVDRPFFLPAATAGEAIERIFSLTGASDVGTRGEKRAVVALRDALGLDIETGVTSDVMGAALAEALHVDWDTARYLDRHKITLDGLNALLEGAADAYAEGSLRRLAEMRPALLDGPEWALFEPARSKIEAVNRISMLTGSGAERLGPGGKEHKRVLVNLVDGMRLGIPITTKHGTAEALAREFNAPWSDICVSTQGTITLTGLNVILAGAERHLGRLGGDRALLFGTPEEEGRALAAALVDGFSLKRFADGSERVHWDGRRSVKWLADNQTGQQNQMEWPGFYWEFQARTILGRRFAPNRNPPKTKYGPEPFDYSLNYVWDLKSHTETWFDPLTGETTKGRGGSPLNDAQSMDECIADQGLGFLMVGGRAITDTDGAFKAWQDALKGKAAAPSNSGRSRMRKAAFEPLHVDAFWFADTLALNSAVAAGHVTGFKQGPQAPRVAGEPGAARRPKYTLSSKAAGTSLHLVRYEFPSRPPKA